MLSPIVKINTIDDMSHNEVKLSYSEFRDSNSAKTDVYKYIIPKKYHDNKHSLSTSIWNSSDKEVTIKQKGFTNPRPHPISRKIPPHSEMSMPIQVLVDEYIPGYSILDEGGTVLLQVRFVYEGQRESSWVFAEQDITATDFIHSVRVDTYPRPSTTKRRNEHEGSVSPEKVESKDGGGWFSWLKGKSTTRHPQKSNNNLTPRSLLSLDRHCHVIHEQESEMANDHDIILSQMRGLLISI